MRYDRQEFIKWDVMKWCCWDCGYEIITTNLHDAVELVRGEEE